MARRRGLNTTNLDHLYRQLMCGNLKDLAANIDCTPRTGTSRSVHALPGERAHRTPRRWAQPDQAARPPGTRASRASRSAASAPPRLRGRPIAPSLSSGPEGGPSGARPSLRRRRRRRRRRPSARGRARRRRGARATGGRTGGGTRRSRRSGAAAPARGGGSQV